MSCRIRSRSDSRASRTPGCIDPSSQSAGSACSHIRHVAHLDVGHALARARCVDDLAVARCGCDLPACGAFRKAAFTAPVCLALCTAGTVFAAEDRWLVAPSGSTRSVRTRTTDGPRRCVRVWRKTSGFRLPFAAVRARGFLIFDGRPALRSASDVARDEVEETNGEVGQGSRCR
jgi:hypothetical protein